MSDHPIVELNVGGTWTDITSYVRYSDRISIRRGRSAEASQASTSTCTMTLDNRDGRFSPRNPTGAYYGQIGRNTPIRVSVDGGLAYLDCPGGAGDKISTPDTAALDITGDIDVRIEMFLLDWNTATTTEVFGKYTTAGDQRSWRLTVDGGGYLALTWSANGSTLRTAVASTSLANNGRSRMAVRATLDVDNGAAGQDVKFYTADSIDGSWTQLGTTVTLATAGTIYNSTAPLEIGDIANDTTSPLTGRVYKAEIRDGIDGTIVANPDFTAQAVGTTSFADSAGRTWTVAGDAALSNRHIRFTGEVASWPVDWDISGSDVVTSIEASGIIRRLTQSESPLRSPMFRDLTNPERFGIIAYWPLEDASSAASFASGMPGHPAMTYTGTPSLASSDAWIGSEPLPAMGTGTFTGAIPSYTTTNETITQFVLAVPSGGVSAATELFSVYTTGTARRWTVTLNTDGSMKVAAYDSEGAELLGKGYVGFGVNGDKTHILFDLIQNGSDIDWQLWAFDYTNYTSISDGVSGGATSDTLTGYTVGRATRITIGDGGLGDTVIGHVSLADRDEAYAETGQALIGLRGESGTNRLRRLIQDEEGIPYQLHTRGKTGNSVTMGPQGVKDFIDLVREIEETDLGILYEPRDEIGLAYRSRLSLYNQDVSLSLDYSQNELSGPPAPVDDDRYTRNDITVTRDGGSFYRATLEDGALSVLEPPNGVGRYQEGVTISLGTDAQLGNQAAWRLHLGTVDEARYPQISINLRHASFTGDATKTSQALTIEVGDLITITNPPSWLPPDDINLIVIGFTETYGALERDITINCVPASPYNTAVATSTTARADTSGSTLSAAAGSSDTSLKVLTQDGSAIWTTTTSDFPFDLLVGGEVVTVSSIADIITDTFARTSSNGWGTADTGNVWQNSGGTSADFQVTGGYGSHRLATANFSRRSFTDFTYTDFDAYVSMTPSATATGGFLSGGLTGRYLSNDNLYTARLAFNSTGSTTLTIRKRVDATETELGTYTGPTYTAGTYYRLRFQVSGSTLRAKMWQSSTPEPPVWHVEVTDTSHTTSTYFGTRSISASTNTNVNPEIRYQSLRVVNPQNFTVTRAVNGVVKSHTAGTQARLADPVYVAL